METKQILAAIDEQISRLVQARTLLGGGVFKPQSGSITAKRKRVLSPEARKRIVEGQRKRWAKVRKAARAK
jgi:hypothetical protein